MAVPLAAVAGALMKSTEVIGGVVTALSAIPRAVRPFVDAFNPQAGLRLDKAMMDLYATIGYALEPVIMGAVDVIDAFSGAIVGAMDRLRAAIAAITSLMKGVLRPIIALVGTLFDGLASVVSALMPVFRVIATYLEGWYSVLRVVVTIFTTLAESVIVAIVNAFGGMTSVTKFLTDAFVGLIKAVLEVTFFFLELFGKQDLVTKILERLAGEGPAKGRSAVPGGYGLGTMEDLYCRRLVEASKAIGGKG